MLLTPSLKLIKPFTPATAKDFEFYYKGSTQIVKNQLVIIRLSDNSIVYDSTINSLQFKHTLAASTLPFGNYKAQIRVGDMSNNWSNYSDWMFFWILEQPTISINTIVNGEVFNQTVNFEATYTHLNPELLESFRYILYDNQRNLLKAYDEIFADGSSPLSQEIAGLENDSNYFVEVKTISIHGQEFTTGLIPFKPKYITPRLSAVLMTENQKEQGAVKLTANILQLIGEVTGDYSYIDDEWIDLTNGVLTFEEGFNSTQSNFILKIWGKNIVENVVFLTLHGNNGWIEFKRINNHIHAFKYLRNVKYPAHYVSNELIVTENQEYMIYILSYRNALDIEQKLIEVSV